jgi:hypothetical protein
MGAALALFEVDIAFVEGCHRRDTSMHSLASVRFSEEPSGRRGSTSSILGSDK